MEGSTNLMGYATAGVLVLLVVVAVVLAATALRAGGTTTASIEPRARTDAPDGQSDGATRAPRDRVQSFLVIAVLFLLAERALSYGMVLL